MQQERPLQPPEPVIETHRSFDRRDGGKPGAAKQSGVTRYRLAVGRRHGTQPKHIVGAIANEAGLDGRAIGRIEVCEVHSIVDLPDDLPGAILRKLQDVQIFGHPLHIKPFDERTRSHATPAKYPKGGRFVKNAKSAKGKPKKAKFRHG